ncbi:MAG: hypothetical protein O3C27_02315 [Actinomycetota bacterium]|nr:hypothetical protein [Actinomycetota bacterium]
MRHWQPQAKAVHQILDRGVVDVGLVLRADHCDRLGVSQRIGDPRRWIAQITF